MNICEGFLKSQKSNSWEGYPTVFKEKGELWKYNKKQGEHSSC